MPSIASAALLPRACFREAYKLNKAHECQLPSIVVLSSISHEEAL